MQYTLGFGNGVQTVEVDDRNLAGVLIPNKITPGLTGAEEVTRALDEPIESPPLEMLAKGKKKVVIITSDITRPMPTDTAAPPVLDRLFRAGVNPENILVVFGLGSHRRQTDEEKKKLLGETVYHQVRCVDSTECEFVHMGDTTLGTPVDIVREVAEADLRIALGNIEYHYFAGYSGGSKALMPGVSTRAAIGHNHSRMVEPTAVAGRLEGNPVREDIEEAARICPIHFLLNVVLDEHKKIVHAVAGHPVKAHRVGCAMLDELYKKEISALADIVIVSQGGAPKDLNLYQTQKALDNAKHAVRKGGVIILVGSCREGLGEATFEKWMTEATDPQWLIEKIQSDFKLGGHKAAAIALVLQNADIYLVSEMKPDFVRSIFMKPFSDVQEALDIAMAKLGKTSKVLLMPYGGSTLPVLK